MSKSTPEIAEMLLEICVTELEDIAADLDSCRTIPLPVIQESSHPYCDNAWMQGQVKIPGKCYNHVY